MNDLELLAWANSTPHRQVAEDLGWTDGKFRGKLRTARKRTARIEDREPRILTFDIETSLMKVYAWRVGDQYIDKKQIIKDWYVHSWAAKWLGDTNILHAVQTPKEAKNNDDKRIVTKMWELINDADIVVGHNIKNFDLKKLNWRWLVHGLNEPLPYKPVDTLQLVRSKFGSTSRALDYLTKELKIPNKTSTGYELWKACDAGDAKSLKKMDKYCQNDILINEALYIRIRGWASTHPNLGLYKDYVHQTCRNCASLDVVPQLKIAVTPANKFWTYRCSNCGHAGRYKESLIDIERRRNLLV